MKIPKECPKCGCVQIHTETGRDITRYYEYGIFTKEINRPLERRVFCDGCGYEFYQDDDNEK